MTTLIYTLINLAYLTTGRRLYALKLGLAAAVALDLDALSALIREAIQHDTRTLEMEVLWTRSRNVSTARGRSFQLDSSIDAVLGSIHTILSNNVRLFDPEQPLCIASATLLERLFPEGVRPIITLPFEEQLAMNQSLINRMNGELNDAVIACNLTPYLTHLESLNAEFSIELQATASKEISFSDLEAARDRGNLYVRRIVAMILGTFNGETDADGTNRQALLAPFLEQDDRIRRNRKGRRVAQDIDPETGEEQSPEESAA